VFHLRAYVPPSQVEDVTRALTGRAGVRHVVLSGVTADSGAALVTAEVDAAAADDAVADLTALGVAARDLSIARVEVARPIAPESAVRETTDRSDALVWTEVADEALESVGLRAGYLAYMAVAGAIAAFGVLEGSAILIVGAMAVSPDLLPLTAAAVAVVARRPRLFRRAIGTLLPGLAAAVATAAVVTLLLRVFAVVGSGADIHTGVVYGLAHVSVTTVCVALAAGVAGMLSFETRASYAVGVAISVTTIPAAAYIGVAAGLGEWRGALGALAVLAVNLAMLLLAGIATLGVQAAGRRRPGG
jgi:uncharacterized hydrophobic protein (TIGR00271 family)